MIKTAKQKNGTIELMRFIFTSCILFFHISGMLWNRKKVIMPLTSFDIMFFRNGAIRVEFFFIVSGYLLAAACFKKNSNGMSTAAGSLPVETGREIVRRGWKMWPYYFPACILSLITSTTIYGAISDGDLVKRIPAFFYLQELCLWKLAIYLGSITLPIYLMQVAVIDWANYLFSELRPGYRLLIVYTAPFEHGARLF